MKASLAYLLPAAASLVAASPLTARQELEIDLLEAAEPPAIASVPVGPASQTVGYDLPAATQDALADPLPVEAVARRSAAKRDACSPQPRGAGPVPSPDTADAFLASPDFSSAAAAATGPAGYYSTFSNLKASNNAYGLLGFRTLDSYDAEACAARCNGDENCSGFNLYFERSPSVSPDAGCEDPPSTTAIKCVWWGGLINKDNALNDGQWRNKFHVVIAGSNGYMKSRVPAVAGYTGQALGDATINAPLDCNGKDTYMGAKVFTTSFFDPKLCTAACEAQNKYNLAHPPAGGKAPKLCKFVTTYLSAKNGQPQGQYCAMYTQPWDKALAKNTGQVRGADRYTIGYAFSYSNDASPGLPVCPRDIDYLRSEGADFCTSFVGYQAPATTLSTTITTFPPQTALTTATTTVTTKIGTTTIRSYVQKRSDAAEVDHAILTSIAAQPEASMLASVFPNITEALPEATATPTGDLARRADGAAVLPTPTSIAQWEAASISAACAQVATGTLTVSETSTITSLTTVATVVVSTQTVSDISPAATVIQEVPGLTRDGRCGPGFGNQHCGDVCCSTWGWCGGGDQWCLRRLGCNDMFGQCR